MAAITSMQMPRARRAGEGELNLLALLRAGPARQRLGCVQRRCTGQE